MKELVRPKFWQAVLFWPKSRRQGRVGLGVDRWWKACVWASVYYASVLCVIAQAFGLLHLRCFEERDKMM